jgi:hypothetical protein
LTAQDGHDLRHAMLLRKKRGRLPEFRNQE